VWAKRLHDYAGSPALATELSYWLDRRANADIPCDDDHGGIDLVADADEVLVSFERELTQRLLKDAPSAYRTQINDLLLAGLGRAVWRWSGRDDVLVELEGHGREDLFDGLDISRTVGWFTTAFPVRLAGGSQNPASLIKTVKEELRGIPGRGLGYGVLRYLGAEEQRTALAGVAEPKISFNYLGQIDGSVEDAALFAMASESAGPSRDASSPLRRWLSVNGTVREGQLRLSFGFGRKRYRRETVERLGALYQTARRDLVDQCTSGPCGLTPADVALPGLGQARLARLGAEWRAGGGI